jgi:carbamoyl-phosphate synthase small subunit
MLGRILFNVTTVPEVTSQAFEDPNKVNLVDQVSTKSVTEYGTGDKTVIAIDTGMKWNQVRCLVKRGVKVRVVPWNHDLSQEKNFHGIFISNGPGDPTMCKETIVQIRNFLQVLENVSHSHFFLRKRILFQYSEFVSGINFSDLPLAGKLSR